MKTEKTDFAGRFDRLRREAEASIARKGASRGPDAYDLLELMNELEIHQVEFELQNEELQRVQKELSGLHKKFSDLYELAPCGYLNLDSHGLIHRINLTGVSLLGKSRRTLLRTNFGRYVSAAWQDAYYDALSTAGKTGEKQRLELQMTPAAGPVRRVWAEIEAESGPDGAVQRWRVTLADISLMKEVETALRERENRYRSLFAAMVIGAVVLELVKEEGAGETRDVQFIEVNAAFEKLAGLRRDRMVGRTIRGIWPEVEPSWFQHMDKDKITCNLNEMTRPHLDRLAATNLSRRQRILLQAVETGLEEIASPLSRRFKMDSIRLTPAESRVAGLIRQGKSTKEIAAIMGVATSTIDFHRHNLRSKLRLGRNTNLQSYLNSLE